MKSIKTASSGLCEHDCCQSYQLEARDNVVKGEPFCTKKPNTCFLQNILDPSACADDSSLVEAASTMRSIKTASSGRCEHDCCQSYQLDAKGSVVKGEPFCTKKPNMCFSKNKLDPSECAQGSSLVDAASTIQDIVNVSSGRCEHDCCQSYQLDAKG